MWVLFRKGVILKEAIFDECDHPSNASDIGMLTRGVTIIDNNIKNLFEIALHAVI